MAEKLVNNLRQVHVSTEEGKDAGSATGEFIEPVQLQVVCYQLWEQLRETPGTEITGADLERLASGQDLSVFIDRALAEFYEQVLGRVLKKAGSQVSEMELRRWFGERLITEAGTRGFVYRGESETGGLPNEVVRLIAAEFLIRSESRAGGTWYELSHDRFVNPIRRSNQRWSLEQLQRDPLLRHAHQWADSNPDHPDLRDQRLLLSHEELATLDLAGHAQEPVMHDFLEASQQAKKDRDLATARQQEQAALRRAKTAFQRQLVLGGLVIVALLAFIMAVRQTGIAKNAEATAVAEQTVSAANADAAENLRGYSRRRAEGGRGRQPDRPLAGAGQPVAGRSHRGCAAAGPRRQRLFLDPAGRHRAADGAGRRLSFGRWSYGRLRAGCAAHRLGPEQAVGVRQRAALQRAGDGHAAGHQPRRALAGRRP
ncbi:MAG: hypothetical protein V9H69_01095 [Anaerolineae bacterium]